ncbi:hypothetical protein F5Y16DRAFT_389709 [Xylariaceae sp. FL0255]|nr:hypothetical protein F5Y16DRAFT_389709 [Xylariaceae sp. FL0255]
MGIAYTHSKKNKYKVTGDLSKTASFKHVINWTGTKTKTVTFGPGVVRVVCSYPTQTGERCNTPITNNKGAVSTHYNREHQPKNVHMATQPVAQASQGAQTNQGTQNTNGNGESSLARYMRTIVFFCPDCSGMFHRRNEIVDHRRNPQHGDTRSEREITAEYRMTFSDYLDVVDQHTAEDGNINDTAAALENEADEADGGDAEADGHDDE